MVRWGLLISAFALLFFGLQAQPGARNPFDIEARLPHSLRVVPSSPAFDALENPFNIVPHRRPEVGLSSVEAVTVLPAAESFSHYSAWGPPLTERQIFWLLVLLLTFLAFVAASKRDVVFKAWRAFLSDNALNVALREASGGAGSRPYYLLYASFLLNAGVFLFLLARHFAPEVYNRLSFFLICLSLTPILFIGKHLILSFLGRIFPIRAEMHRYSFLIVLFNCVLGLFLLPFNFLLAQQRPYSGFLVFWLVALAVIFYLYRYLRAGAIAVKFLRQHLFHFLLYLCSVEIAPILVFLKLAIRPS